MKGVYSIMPYLKIEFVYLRKYNGKTRVSTFEMSNIWIDFFLFFFFFFFFKFLQNIYNLFLTRTMSKCA